MGSPLAGIGFEIELTMLLYLRKIASYIAPDVTRMLQQQRAGPGTITLSSRRCAECGKDFVIENDVPKKPSLSMKPAKKK